MERLTEKVFGSPRYDVWEVLPRAFRLPPAGLDGRRTKYSLETGVTDASGTWEAPDSDSVTWRRVIGTWFCAHIPVAPSSGTYSPVCQTPTSPSRLHGQVDHFRVAETHFGSIADQVVA